jgi:hypothetical protein
MARRPVSLNDRAWSRSIATVIVASAARATGVLASA